MTPRSAGPTTVPTDAAERRPVGSGRVASGRQRAAAALAFAVRCHARQRRDSDGAPFIEHPLEVARLLRDAGCTETLVAAGLLHHVTTSCDVGQGELARRFGAEVARLVAAVSEDASVHSYRRRKQVLLEQVRGAGVDAAVLLAADRISRLRELPAQAGRDRTRFDAAAPGSRAWDQLEYFEQLRLEHCHRSLRLVNQVAPGHPLAELLADELDQYALAIGRGPASGDAGRGQTPDGGGR